MSKFQHDTIITILDSWYKALSFETLTFPLVIEPNSSIFVSLTMKLFSRRQMDFPWWQLLNLSWAWMSSFWSNGLFLGQHHLSKIKLWLCTVMLVFQHFPVGCSWVFLKIINNFLYIWGWYMVFLLDLSKMATNPNVLYLCTIVWMNELGICSCLKMVPRQHPNLCKSIILLLRS